MLSGPRAQSPPVVCLVSAFVSGVWRSILANVRRAISSLANAAHLLPEMHLGRAVMCGMLFPDDGTSVCDSSGLLPGIDTTLDVACCGDAGILCRLHCHSGTLTEGAVEQQAFAG
jgi:hypothetical protein